VTTLICRFKDHGANFRLSGCRENRTFWVTSLTDWVTSLTELRNTDRELRLVELRGPGRCTPALGLPPGGDAAAASSRACAERTHLNRASVSARRMRLLSAEPLPQKASSCKQKRADAPGHDAAATSGIMRGPGSVDPIIGTCTQYRTELAVHPRSFDFAQRPLRMRMRHAPAWRD